VAASGGADTSRLNPAEELDAGELASRLRYFTRPKRDLRRRQSDIDAAAVLRALQDEGLTLQQCADRFTTSTDTITKILWENGIQPYMVSRGRSEARVDPSASSDTQAIDSPQIAPAPPATQPGRKRPPPSLSNSRETRG
jgi:hypothetical protein